MHAGERIRGFIAAQRIPQKTLALALETDPGTVSRRLDKDNPDAWETFLLGVALGELVTSNSRNGNNKRNRPIGG